MPSSQAKHCVCVCGGLLLLLLLLLVVVVVVLLRHLNDVFKQSASLVFLSSLILLPPSTNNYPLFLASFVFLCLSVYLLLYNVESVCTHCHYSPLVSTASKLFSVTVIFVSIITIIIIVSLTARVVANQFLPSFPVFHNPL